MGTPYNRLLFVQQLDTHPVRLFWSRVRGWGFTARSKSWQPQATDEYRPWEDMRIFVFSPVQYESVQFGPIWFRSEMRSSYNSLPIGNVAFARSNSSASGSLTPNPPKTLHPQELEFRLRLLQSSLALGKLGFFESESGGAHTHLPDMTDPAAAPAAAAAAAATAATAASADRLAIDRCCVMIVGLQKI